MGNWIRKQKRQELKKEVGSNEIRDAWHQRNSTLGQILQEGMKRAREKNNKK